MADKTMPSTTGWIQAYSADAHIIIRDAEGEIYLFNLGPGTIVAPGRLRYKLTPGALVTIVGRERSADALSVSVES